MIIDFLFPRVCHLCGTRISSSLEREEFLCSSCLARLPRTLYHQREGNPMEMRFAGLIPFERATGHFFYSGGSELSQLMQDLKYRRFRNFARFMGEKVGEELAMTGFMSDIDVIVPIPMHFLKKAKRGYNQTEEIAAGVAKATGLRVDMSLRAQRPHRTQTALTTEARQENLKDVFALKSTHNLDGKHILLLDDVCTTGTTLTEAASTLLKGAKGVKVSMLTLGVTF